jgi:hypothetical protein
MVWNTHASTMTNLVRPPGSSLLRHSRVSGGYKTSAASVAIIALNAVQHKSCEVANMSSSNNIMSHPLMEILKKAKSIAHIECGHNKRPDCMGPVEEDNIFFPTIAMGRWEMLTTFMVYIDHLN